ncbi:MAG: type II toxin-antitoxin system Phd/YefM family antitoxin [Bifidobacteriaceae bacterium]|jgi:prevent-host-death family protein|nr:type II toxin-antitoxin system Phd/YefM family antitoxin [Bifidobacteriaceae bacterium]
MTSVGVKDLRANLADYIKAGEPVQITRRGKVVGVLTPAKPAAADRAALAASHARVEAQLASASVDPEDLIEDFERRRPPN